MTYRSVTECQSCGSPYLERILYVGAGAPANSMRSLLEPPRGEMMYPLELLRCERCSLVQLSVIVDPAEVFHRDYPYSSGNSPQLREHFTRLARAAEQFARMDPAVDLVVDIGANDGTLLAAFHDGGYQRTVGVEPTDQAAKIAGPVFQDWFSRRVTDAVVDAYGRARVVTACNVLAHVADVHGTLDAVRELLADDGFLIAENHDLASIVAGGQWDTIYHEHLRFYNVHSFARLLELHGLYVWHHHEVGTHGGSHRVFASKKKSGSVAVPSRSYDFERMRSRFTKSRAWIRAGVSAHRAAGQRVAGVGASARASTIIAACGLDVDDLEAVYEVDGSDKIGRFMAGTAISVRNECELFDIQPDFALVFSWHLQDVIVRKLRNRGYGGTILIPLPELSSLRLPFSDHRSR